MSTRTIGWFTILALGTSFGCDHAPGGGYACTDVGCEDGVQLSVRAPDNTWAPGTYRFELTFDDVSHICEATLPDDLPPLGSATSLSCDPALRIAFMSETKCVEQRSADTASLTCTPIAGHWLLDGFSTGTPKSVGVHIERDGVPLVDHSETPSYSESRPNGPHCDPLCRQARIELALPPQGQP